MPSPQKKNAAAASAENAKKAPEPQIMRCAVIPEQVFQMWLDSYRDALVSPKSSQPVLEALKQVQFGNFPMGNPQG